MNSRLLYILCFLFLLPLNSGLAGYFKNEHFTPAARIPDDDAKMLLRKADRIIREAEKISGRDSKTIYSKPRSCKVKKSDVSERSSVAVPNAIKSYPIMNVGYGTREQIVHFIIRNNTLLDPAYVIRLVNAYMVESKREGVNHDIAVCQMCLETGFLKFSGTVSKFQNNFCGLGATDPWSAGDSFRNMEEGVRAHIQHLKAYASEEPIVPPFVDPRLDHVKRGSAKTIHELTGRWASDPGYGDKIEGLLKQLHSQ